MRPAETPHKVRVLVVGSVNMDVVTPMRWMPAPGETIHVDDVTLAPGGKGANAAVSAARMGAAVRFVGCVGDDAFGDQLRASLEYEGIDCTQLRTVSRGTGTAVILLDRDSGQNAIMVGPGANDEVKLPEDDAVFAGIDIVMLQLETPMAVNIQAAERARALGLPVILDPAPAVAELPEALLRAVTMVSPNETELATLTGKPVNSIDDACDAARVLLNRGAEQVIVKLGAQGALWVTADEHQHVPAVKVQVVDTTAAGDAFTGALAVGLAEGLDTNEAIRRACITGSLACTKLGAQPSIPDKHAVLAFREQTQSS